MNPGQAPVRVDGMTFNQLSVGLQVIPPGDFKAAEAFVAWMTEFGTTHIEPIESGDVDDQP